jgi:glycosyltransferase involved in cell wall biosynthesis
MSSPKVSVIMPTHNGMPYLKEAVESILKQTYKNFEFIIVDDASSDKTLQYLKSLKDKRIKLIRNKQNLGVAKSLNKALKAARGEFIARMDADDVSYSARLKEQIEFFKKSPQIFLCGTWAELINNSGKIIGEKKYPSSNKNIKRALLWYTPIIHPSLMARKKVFTKLNGYNPKFDMAEDYEFLIRARENYNIANIPRKLIKWRLHDKRRSRAQMHQMGKVDLAIKIESLKKGYFSPVYFPVILMKFASTYLVPTPIKVQLSKLLKRA